MDRQLLSSDSLETEVDFLEARLSTRQQTLRLAKLEIPTSEFKRKRT